MGDDNKEELLLKDFLELLLQPEDLGASIVWKKNENENGRHHDHQVAVLRETCRLLFQQIEGLARTYSSSVLQENNNGPAKKTTLTGLKELYMGSTTAEEDDDDDDEPVVVVDAETLWGQVDLQNAALQSLLKKSVKKLTKAAAAAAENNDDASSTKQKIMLLNDIDDDDDESDDEENEEHSQQQESQNEEETGEDLETRRMRARMARVMEDMDGEEEEEDDEFLKEENHEDRIGKAEEGKGRDEELLVDDPVAERMRDGFFDLLEMEAFADEEEEYLPDEAYGREEKPPPPPADEPQQEKRSFHQRQRDGDMIDSGGSDEKEEYGLLFRSAAESTTVRRRKYREDDEIEALHSLYELPRPPNDKERDDCINLTAADIFGEPDKKLIERWSSRSKTRDSDLKAREDDDADSWDGYNFSKEDDQKAGWGIHGDENSGINEDGASDEEVDAGIPMKNMYSKAEIDSETVSPTKNVKSNKLLFQTELLEKEMLAEKPWQLTGEATSAARPVNSLLELTPEFEVATKMVPMVTIEHTASLEEVIKGRILNEDWDDVIPRELPDVGWHQKRGELPEVSQEKSKLSLGELYEREYLKKAVGYDVEAAEKETEEEKAKNEMKSLFANLCSKLDALSNYHFAPRPMADEAEVRPVTKPAIAMEEVLPLHVSDARGVAPEEVFATKRGREGILRSESEMDQNDRKRLRASKKAARRKARKEKLADEKLVSRLQPGLGLDNPYEKRKMREELSMARAHGKVTAGKADTNDYAASGTFFKRLQQEAEQTVRGGEEGSRKKEADERRVLKSSSALKL